jgi:hypothetical protein
LLSAIYVANNHLTGKTTKNIIIDNNIITRNKNIITLHCNSLYSTMNINYSINYRKLHFKEKK